MDFDDFFEDCIGIANQQAESRQPYPIQAFLHDESLAPPIHDFLGLPSSPPCIYRSGPARFVRDAPATQFRRTLYEVCPVSGDHPIQERWLDIGRLIYEYLDSCGVQWTSIDPVRFIEAEMRDAVPTELYLWIGVIPGTLTSEAAELVAQECKEILSRQSFPTVEVAFRESIVIPLVLQACTFAGPVGPRLLPWTRDSRLEQGLFPSLRAPFTPTLPLALASSKTPWNEGTGGIYLRESKDSERVFVLTAAHAIRSETKVKHSSESQRHVNDKVILLGARAYDDALLAMMAGIAEDLENVETWNTELEHVGAPSHVDSEADPRYKRVQSLIAAAQNRISDTNELHTHASKFWSSPRLRAIGRIAYRSAPDSSNKNIAENSDVESTMPHFTQDWALVELFHNKINWESFLGNKVYISDHISSTCYILKLHPHLGRRPNSQPRSAFHGLYPEHGLLQISGFLSESDIHHPKPAPVPHYIDADDEGIQEPQSSFNYFLVFKNGATTKMTFGRLSSLESFVRRYPNLPGHRRPNSDSVTEYGDIKGATTSIELAVYPYSIDDGAFARPGDSGSMVLDSEGHLVGMVSSGSGAARPGLIRGRGIREDTKGEVDVVDIDVTYLTPWWWIDKGMRELMPEYCLYE